MKEKGLYVLCVYYIHDEIPASISIFIDVITRGKFTLDAHLALYCVIWAQSSSTRIYILPSQQEKQQRRSKRKIVYTRVYIDVAGLSLYTAKSRQEIKRKLQIRVMTTPWLSSDNNILIIYIKLIISIGVVEYFLKMYIILYQQI